MPSDQPRDHGDVRERSIRFGVHRYTQFISPVHQEATQVQLLPTSPPDQEDAGPPEEYISNHKPTALLAGLLPRYVDAQVYRAMLESLASEHGARMTAMSSATTNAGEMIDRLTLDSPCQAGGNHKGIDRDSRRRGSAQVAEYGVSSWLEPGDNGD